MVTCTVAFEAERNFLAMIETLKVPKPEWYIHREGSQPHNLEGDSSETGTGVW